ncbi:MAG: EAL domain-containing protein [Methyloversatilis sp.]|uniref:EAL domain-containing protein n=1 Tax=Methyloversatilis sp. TaxID=2569862 RepID=UPI0027352657|nr:EAL domain-containing protein [Methyloversatilis sp.]MDP3872569.1 EAL domain-containing protein [Methyloversatilis sp.]
MILTDPEGTILDVEGDPHLREAVERVRLVPGANWNESASGTNAIGTALALGQPMQVHASEHFCAGIQKWSCSAAVIRDPVNGAILGVLDISGSSSAYNQYSLPFAAMTAERIENRLSELETGRRFNLLEASTQRLASCDGVIVFDRHGNLVKANERAAAALAAWDVTLSAGTRMPVPGAVETPGSLPGVLPEWLLANRVEPVLGGNKLLGFVVSVPLLPPLSAPPSAPAADVAASPLPELMHEPREALLSTMLDQSSSLVFLKDMAGRYEFVNRCFEEVFGVRSADVLGRTDAQIFDAALAHELHRKDLEAIGRSSRSESVDELKLGQRTVRLAAVRFPIRDSGGEIRSICTQANEIAQPLHGTEGPHPATVTAALVTDEGVMVTDAQGRIVTVNAAFTRITGYSIEDVTGKPPGILKSGLHSKEFYQRMWRSLADQGRWQGEIQNRRKNGDIFLEWLTIYSIKSADGEVQNYIAIFGDNSATQASQRHVEFMGTHDAVTGLPNRKLLMERLHECVVEAARLKGRIAVMLIDLDNFRDINDSLGHQLGDQLLRQIAERLRRCMCDAHTIAGLGGDEYAIVLIGATAEEVHCGAANILDYLSASFRLGGKELFVTTSIGISLFPEDGDTAADLLKNAGTAMHAARAGGRNGYQFFSGAMNARLQQRMSIETGLRAAIAHDRFRIVYQPQDDLASGAMVGAEALLRWTDPDMGEVSAARFIPVAEEAGLIITIGDIVFSKVFAQMALWRRLGLVLPRISINVAAQQMREPQFVEHLCELLENHGVAPEAICIELTEGSLMADLDKTSHMLSRIARHGISVSIDDFGTGYSSLSYLSRLPIQELKVDQSFIRTIADEAGNRSITTAIIDMAHALGMTVLAEGVETGAQLQILKDRHCETGQGYYFHRPLSTEAFEKLLTEKSLTAPPPLTSDNATVKVLV